MWADEAVVLKESCGIPEYRRQSHSAGKDAPNFVAQVFLSVALIISWTSMAAPAQQTTQTLPDSPSASQTKKTSGSETRPLEVVTFLERRSVFFPDLASSPGPLSTGEKFKLFLDDSIAPNTVLSSAVGSAITQAADSPRGFGQGWDGYGKRFGSSMARRASSEFFGTFLLAAALRQDPRFFPLLHPTVGSSVKYSVSRVFVTRNDEGKNVVNWSGLFGTLLSESLANAYWPEQDRTAGQTFRRIGVSLSTSAASNMFRNYWPSIFKNLRRVTPGMHDPHQ